MRLKWLSGDVNWVEYGGKWVSPKQNKGEFDYWYVLEFINMWDATGETDQPKYRIEISAVSPEQAGKEEMKRAKDCCGWMNMKEEDDLAKVEVLHSYGLCAPLKSYSGNNYKKLFREARKELMAIDMLFGFYMDQPKNLLGHTGWDWIKGDLSVETALANQKEREEYAKRERQSLQERGES